MKYAVEMGSGAMIYSYIPSFIKIGSGIQTLTRGYSQTHRQLYRSRIKARLKVK
jgi:hypothetical protein